MKGEHPDPRTVMNPNHLEGEPTILRVTLRDGAQTVWAILNDSGYYRTRDGKYIDVSTIDKIERPLAFEEVDR